MRGEGPTSYNSSLSLISGLCCTEEYTQVCMIIKVSNVSQSFPYQRAGKKTPSTIPRSLEGASAFLLLDTYSFDFGSSL